VSVTRRTGALLFGGDYNPEQWPEEVWLEDVRLMAEARVNAVSVGIFSWSSIEPEEGRYEFGWLDRVLALLHEHGISVLLATPTASPPPWFTRAHPEAMPVTREGVRLVHGSRDTYNPAAPAYREACARVARALGERYGAHPAVVAWHVHNEYGSVSYGADVDREFRRWLERRYGALAELNRAWNTPFWSQGYSAWDEILAPQATQYLPNPTQVLDFRRFTGDLLLECYREQIAILRELSPGVPVTTNFILPDWLHFDHWDFAAASDFVSVDHYVDSSGVEGAAHAAFGADQARSFGNGREWLLMEQSANVTSSGGRMLAKAPGDLKRTSLQHIARGSNGALFFQWRAPLAGAEFFHSTLVPHVGEDSRLFRDVVDLGRTLESLAELAADTDGPVARPRVAIAWSADAWWAAETAHLPSDALAFQPAVRRVHRQLWLLGVNADFVHPESDLSAYSVVLVPRLLIATRAAAENLSRFTESGGSAVVWYFSGSLDEELHVYPGGYSGAFAELLGVRVEELFPLVPGDAVPLSDGTSAVEWTERVSLRGADAVTRYADGILAGDPALTVHAVGAGTARYVSTELADDALRGLLATVLAEAGVEPDAPGAGDGLEAVRRRAGDAGYLFLINHAAEPRTSRARGVDLITGAERDGELVLAPGEFLVLREPAAM
jgi:beta-galactosidase